MTEGEKENLRKYFKEKYGMSLSEYIKTHKLSPEEMLEIKFDIYFENTRYNLFEKEKEKCLLEEKN